VSGDRRGAGDRRNGNGNGTDPLHDSLEYDSSERAETRPAADPYSVLATALLALTGVVEERFDKIELRMDARDKRDDAFQGAMLREIAKLGQRVSLVDEHEAEITGQVKAIETIAAAVSRVEQATPHKVWSRMIALVGATSALVEKHSTLAKLAAATVVFAAQIYIAWHVTHPH